MQTHSNMSWIMGKIGKIVLLLFTKSSLFAIDAYWICKDLIGFFFFFLSQAVGRDLINLEYY